MSQHTQQQFMYPATSDNLMSMLTPQAFSPFQEKVRVCPTLPEESFLVFIHRGYRLLRYVYRGFRYPLFWLLRSLSGSSYRIISTETQHRGDSNHKYHTTPTRLF